MINILASLIFVGFLFMVLRASLAARSGDIRVQVNQLIIYSVFFSLFAGVAHVELWPFSRWNIFSEHVTQPVFEVRIVALDANKNEYAIDRRALEPFTSLDLYTWLDANIATMSHAQQSEVGAYLLTRLKTGQTRAAAGEHISSFDRYFGPLSAPTHLIYAPIWDDAQRVPQLRFVGLRVYRIRWNVFDRRSDPQAFTRELRYEFREPSQ